MRQAGRYLPEYRELRGDRDILETIRTPEQAAEVTLQPLRRMPVDAAILFSDIVVPLVAVGVPIRIEAGRGPVLDEPFRGDADLARLRPLEPEADEPYVLETVRLLAKELRGAADRVRRRAVHAGELSDRGRPVARSRAHEGAVVERAGGVGPVARGAGRHRGAAPAGAGGRGGERPAGVRLVGGGARPRHLPRARATPHAAVVRRPRRPRRADDPLRRRHRRAARRDGRGGRRRHRHRRARSAGRGLGSDRRPGGPRRAGQPRPDGAAVDLGGRRGRRRSTCSRAPAAATGTSSTWGTACCRPRRSATCSGWSTWCTSARSDERPGRGDRRRRVGSDRRLPAGRRRHRRHRVGGRRDHRRQAPLGRGRRAASAGRSRLVPGAQALGGRAVSRARDRRRAHRAARLGRVPVDGGGPGAVPDGHRVRHPGRPWRRVPVAGRLPSRPAPRAAGLREAEAPRRRRRVARVVAPPPPGRRGDRPRDRAAARRALRRRRRPAVGARDVPRAAEVGGRAGLAAPRARRRRPATDGAASAVRCSSSLVRGSSD